MEQDPTQIEEPPPKKPLRLMIVWSACLAIAYLISLLAILRGGYVGGDYPVHLVRIIEARWLDFAMADPPLYVVIGHTLFRLIGANNSFLVTLSTLQAVTNFVALWCLFLYTERRFKSPV